MLDETKFEGRSAQRMPAKRARAFNRQKGICCYCRGPMSPVPESVSQAPWSATAEHIQQKSRGGNDYHTNIIAACRSCNMARPDGMGAAEYAMLRILLLPAWPACTIPEKHVRQTLSGLIRRKA